MKPEDDRLGLSPQLWGKVKKLGINDPAQLIWFAPSRYRDYRRPRTSLAGIKKGARFFAKLIVCRSPTKRPGKPMWFQVSDGERIAGVSIFGSTSSFSKLSVNSIVFLSGVMGEFNGSMAISSPELVLKHMQGRLVPEYLPGESGIAKQTLARTISELHGQYKSLAVERLEAQISEPSSVICSKLGLKFRDLSEVLDAMHTPASTEVIPHAKEALYRLAAYLSVKTTMQRSDLDDASTKVDASFPGSVERCEDLVGRIPFTLTDDQNRSMREILHDLTMKPPMHRILSGDVGSGKTISYLVPAVAAQRAGKQVVVLMPNSLLASQVVGELSEYFPQTPVLRLTGDDKHPESLSNKPIIIGTTAILFWFEKLPAKPQIDFVIIDEQQKLGMEQKRQIVGPQTHFLEATATPIPRSQALVNFGVSKISRITQLPVKKKIESVVIGQEGRQLAFSRLKKAVASGAQVAVLYPLREEKQDERRGVDNVREVWERLYPGKVGYIHGGMKSAEKTRVMELMKAGDFKVLVSTSIVEIGLTFPSLRMLMVVDAERYGASTLHQFRGRVARKGGAGLFLMMASKELAKLKDPARDRLEMVASTTNGLEIAEKDLTARGFGDLSKGATEQSGYVNAYIPGIKVTPQMVSTVLDLVVGKEDDCRKHPQKNSPLRPVQASTDQATESPTP